MEYFAHFLQKCASRRGRLLVFDRRRRIFEPIQKVLPLWYEMHIFYRTEHFASTECTFSDNNKHGIINLKQDKDGIQMAADGALIGHRWAHMGPRWGSEPSVLNGRSSLCALLGGASPPEPSVLSGRSSLFWSPWRRLPSSTERFEREVLTFWSPWRRLLSRTEHARCKNNVKKSHPRVYTL